MSCFDELLNNKWITEPQSLNPKNKSNPRLTALNSIDMLTYKSYVEIGFGLYYLLESASRRGSACAAVDWTAGSRLWCVWMKAHCNSSSRVAIEIMTRLNEGIIVNAREGTLETQRDTDK